MKGLEEPIDVGCLASQWGKNHHLIRYPFFRSAQQLWNENIRKLSKHWTNMEVVAVPVLAIAHPIESESFELTLLSGRSIVRHARRHSCRTIWIAFHLLLLASTIYLSI